MNGRLIPYYLIHDSWISILILICFISCCYILSKGWKIIAREIKEIFENQFYPYLSPTTREEMQFRFFFELQLCLIEGLLFLEYTTNNVVTYRNSFDPLIKLAIYIGIIFLGGVIKLLIYRFIGWVFFNKDITTGWIKCYYTADLALVFLSFPLMIITIYHNLSPQIYISIGLFLLILTKCLLFFKGSKLFSLQFHGKIYFILYLCALEIIPLILLVLGLFETNNFLQLK